MSAPFFEGYTQGKADGSAEERASIVAWLRQQGAEGAAVVGAIERGVHLGSSFIAEHKSINEPPGIAAEPPGIGEQPPGKWDCVCRSWNASTETTCGYCSRPAPSAELDRPDGEE